MVVSVEIVIIAAMDQNRVIGKDNKLPWHISEDLIRFRRLTSGHPIIMGRKTYESLGKPLPKRENIVLSRQLVDVSGCMIAKTMEEAIAHAKRFDTDIFVIGGAEIYRQSLPLSDKLHLTIVEGQFEGDVYFPDYSEFKNVLYEEQGQSLAYKYKFQTLTR